MTPDEFAARAVGLPWLRWRSDWRACDCYGLIVLYFREVHDVHLGNVPQTEIADGFAMLSGDWTECGPEPGVAAFMSFLDAAPRHCGVMLPGGRLLHAEGAPESGGSVRVSRLSAWSRLYPDTRFYRHRLC